MGEVVQIEASGTTATDGPQSQARVPDRVYKVVAPTGGASQEDLYGFRAAMMQPAPVENPEAEATQAKSKQMRALLPLLLVLILGVLAVLIIPKMTKSSTPPAYVDLGSRRFDSAGIAARLIARWEGATAYQLYIDPVDPQQTAGFQAAAANPPHPISIVIRLLDSSGIVACQKEVVLPTPAPVTATTDPSLALAPMQTTSGDTVQNNAGPDGQIAEVTVTGGLPCSLKNYQSIAGWEFYSNFPSLDEQDSWTKQPKPSDVASSRKTHSAAGGQGISPRVQHLSAALDDDDVIVGDNPLRGTIDTRGGREFLIGVSGLRNRSAEWQVFPAAVHFRCEKNGACVLTRVNSRVTLQARLLK